MSVSTSYEGQLDARSNGRAARSRSAGAKRSWSARTVRAVSRRSMPPRPDIRDLREGHLRLAPAPSHRRRSGASGRGARGTGCRWRGKAAPDRARSSRASSRMPPRELDSRPAKNLPVVLDVVSRLGDRRILEQRTRGAIAGSASGGRFRTGAGAASSPAGGRCPNGRYHTSVGLAASDSPTSSASCGWSERAGVQGDQRRGAQPLDQRRQSAGSSTR